MKNIGQLMKQAQEMQSKMAAAQEEVSKITAEGRSGGSMITVTLNGKGEMQGIKIDPSLLTPDDVEILEDLIVAAHSDAKSKVDTRANEEMSKVTGGLQLPAGMKLPF